MDEEYLTRRKHVSLVSTVKRSALAIGLRSRELRDDSVPSVPLFHELGSISQRVIGVDTRGVNCIRLRGCYMAHGVYRSVFAETRMSNILLIVRSSPPEP